MQDHRQLDIWQRGMDYAVAIYHVAAQLPDEERYNLSAQLRRAAVSVPLNIVEGAGCTSNGEFARFLGYSYRSLKEIETCLELSKRLFPTLPLPANSPLLDEADQISRMTRSFMHRLNLH
jgi:four helix bundle protein